jgi:hypothetical protein
LNHYCKFVFTANITFIDHAQVIKGKNYEYPDDGHERKGIKQLLLRESECVDRIEMLVKQKSASVYGILLI